MCVRVNCNSNLNWCNIIYLVESIIKLISRSSFRQIKFFWSYWLPGETKPNSKPVLPIIYIYIHSTLKYSVSFVISNILLIKFKTHCWRSWRFASKLETFLRISIIEMFKVLLQTKARYRWRCFKCSEWIVRDFNIELIVFVPRWLSSWHNRTGAC